MYLLKDTNIQQYMLLLIRGGVVNRQTRPNACQRLKGTVKMAKPKLIKTAKDKDLFWYKDNE
jgi:hypothetical protein